MRLSKPTRLLALATNAVAARVCGGFCEPRLRVRLAIVRVEVRGHGRTFGGTCLKSSRAAITPPAVCGVPRAYARARGPRGGEHGVKQPHVSSPTSQCAVALDDRAHRRAGTRQAGMSVDHGAPDVVVGKPQEVDRDVTLGRVEREVGVRVCRLDAMQIEHKPGLVLLPDEAIRDATDDDGHDGGDVGFGELL